MTKKQKMMLKYSFVILICVGGLTTYFLSTQEVASAPPVKIEKADVPQTYLEWHNQCLSGDTKIIDTHIKQFEAQISKNPNDNLARAYLGSAYALRAKASTWGLTKLKYLNKGKEAMDLAVKSAPKDVRVRMVRAIAYYKVPKRFDTRPTSLEDFKQITPEALSGKTELKINERQAVLYYASLAFEEAGMKESKKMKQACHKLSPNSKYGRLTTP